MKSFPLRLLPLCALLLAAPVAHAQFSAGSLVATPVNTQAQPAVLNQGQNYPNALSFTINFAQLGVSITRIEIRPGLPPGLDGGGTVQGDAYVVLNRPTVGNAYLGVRSIGGPISSNVLLGSVNYRMSEKWIGTASAAVDFANTGNIGQTFSMTRIGEAMLVTVGMNVDSAKNNVGVHFLIEPRFLPKLQITRQTGIEIPPAGALGLE